MTTTLFSNPTWITVQGSKALKLTYLGGWAEFAVVGFSGTVVLKDYRPHIQSALEQAIEVQQFDEFIAQFNTPAHVELIRNEVGTTNIHLYPSTDIDPSHRLWIAIGLQDSVPVYDYIHFQLTPLNDSPTSYACLALYRRLPQGELLAADWLESRNSYLKSKSGSPTA